MLQGMAKEGALFLHRYPVSIPAQPRRAITSSSSGSPTSKLSLNLSSSSDMPKTQLYLSLLQLHLSSLLLKYPPSFCFTTFSPALLPCSPSAIAETVCAALSAACAARAPLSPACAALSPCLQQPLPRHVGCWLPLPLQATFKRSKITSEIPPCPKLAHKSQHYKNKTVLCVHAHFRLPFKPELVSCTLAEEQRGVGVKRQA